MVKRRAGEPAQSPNRLLAALPPEDYRRIASSLTELPLELKRTLYKPGDIVDDVYFPGGGFASVVTVLANGDMVEVATIGREGMVGASATIPGYREPSLTMVQMEMDSCVKMPSAAFRREMSRSGAFFDMITRFSQGLLGASMQSTACNAVHRIEHRLAKWLLMAHDRVGANQFLLTQEFLAMMLGAARPTVTIVAGTLQRAGLITYKRGRIVVVNRKALEKSSCECYGVTTALLDRAQVGSARSRS